MFPENEQCSYSQWSQSGNGLGQRRGICSYTEFEKRRVQCGIS